MSKKLSLCIEDLSNELWLEIFTYIDSRNLFLAFHGINKRINKLLLSGKFLPLSLSNSINGFHSIHKFFQEYPPEQFQHVKHFKLTFTYLNEDELSIINYLSLFLSLTSLAIHFKLYYDSRHLTGKFIMILFDQHCPYLQRLYIDGYNYENVNNLKPKNINNEFMFYFPSLACIHVEKIYLFLAIQILNKCRQLRSFSTKLFCQDDRSSIPVSSLLSSLFCNLASTEMNMNLTAMKKLNLKAPWDDNENWWNQFLEHLLPCCPNLNTFFVDQNYGNTGQVSVDPNWWTRLFTYNNKLEHISLCLRECQIFDFSHAEVIIQDFQSSKFFIQLKANATYKTDLDFNSISYDVFIKN